MQALPGRRRDGRGPGHRGRGRCRCWPGTRTVSGSPRSTARRPWWSPAPRTPSRRSPSGLRRRRAARRRRLRVSHAFHSPLMEPMLAEFRAVAESVDLRARRSIPVVSGVTGATGVADELAPPDYWVRHVREAVRFADARPHLPADGRRHASSSSARTASSPPWPRTASTDRTAVVAPVLRTGPPRGRARCSPRWPTCTPRARASTGRPSSPAPARGRVDLPTYAFQHERYWLEADAGHRRRRPRPDLGRPPAARRGRRPGRADEAVADRPALAAATHPGSPTTPSRQRAAARHRLRGAGPPRRRPGRLRRRRGTHPPGPAGAARARRRRPPGVGRRARTTRAAGPVRVHSRHEDAPADTPWPLHADGPARAAHRCRRTRTSPSGRRPAPPRWT